MNIFRESVDKEKYIIATYFLAPGGEANVRDAAWNVAIGQSVGNPNVRNQWETDELFENHSCKILADEETLKKDKIGRRVQIAFPIANIDIETDGVSQLLCQLMGGQADIKEIFACHLLDIQFPEAIKKKFSGPKYGIKGVREFTGVHDKPLLGGIVKPKIGVDPQTLLKLVKEMVEGGINFIKEDEIMSNPAICPIEERVPLIMDYLKDKKVIYSVCINADPLHILNRVRRVHELGGNSVHVNFWAGLGVYKSIRELDLPIFLHFQKSGDKILTNQDHDIHIRWKVICDLAGMMGVDFIHAGMLGGYYKSGGDNMQEILTTLDKHGVVPALSCGMHPGLIEFINGRAGINYMANCGGAIHGHPGGTKSGVKAMRQAIDKEYGAEYEAAIEKWGKI